MDGIFYIVDMCAAGHPAIAKYDGYEAARKAHKRLEPKMTARDASGRKAWRYMIEAHYGANDCRQDLAARSAALAASLKAPQ